ncbi:MAG: hypothetical protein AAFU49_22520 [Pseudomonadota bacterium]
MAHVTRRSALALLGLAGLGTAASAHTPYKQWVVYRRKHLLIGCHRDDAEGYRVAKATAAFLVDHLPKSQARVARAPAASRLASLLATDQLDLAVLDWETARAIRQGEGIYAAFGRQEIGTLAMLDAAHCLVAHARFPDRHGSLVAETLIGSKIAPRAVQDTPPPCPWRPETLAVLGR